MFSRLISTVLLGLLLALFPRPAAAQDSLAIHHIDVDQGDATLVVAPNGRTLLIDAGLTGRGDTVARFLRQRGIDTVDAVLATHYDRDHYGGLPRVAEAGITIEAWYDRGGKAFLPENKTDDDNGLQQNDFITETNATAGAFIFPGTENTKLIRNTFDGDFIDTIVDGGEETKLPDPFEPDE